MEKSLPYLVSPGSIKNALERIRQAATPDRVTGDFITTKLSIKGGTGAALLPFLKKIGLVNSDGSPTELYKQFRNPATGGAAIAAAIKAGYKDLGQVNEYFYELGDKELQNLIVQVTGAEADSSVAKLTFSTLRTLKGFANFDAATQEIVPENGNQGNGATPEPPAATVRKVRNGEINLSYTINLNLPATSDQTVFNAIFRSLREHLLSNAE